RGGVAVKQRVAVGEAPRRARLVPAGPTRYDPTPDGTANAARRRIGSPGCRPSPPVVSPPRRPGRLARVGDPLAVRTRSPLGAVARRSTHPFRAAPVAPLPRLARLRVAPEPRHAVQLRPLVPGGLPEDAGFRQRQPAGGVVPAGRRRQLQTNGL